MGIRLKPTILVMLAVAPHLLASCALYRPPERGQDELPVPDAFTLYEETAPLPERWWESFDSEELNRLVDAALSGNLSLQQIYARLLQAHMIARQSGAARWPQLSMNADASETRRHTDTGESSTSLDTASQKLNAMDTLVRNASNSGGSTTNQSTLEALSTRLHTAQSNLQALETLFAEPPSAEMTLTTRSFLLGLTTSYEVDIWGRVRSQHKAALLDLEASREDVYAAMLSLSASVVLQWLDVVAYQQELALVQGQLALNRTTLELMELRYRKGMAIALDVYQQRQIVARTESFLPSLESGMQTARHELAVFLGRHPRSDLEIRTEALPPLGPLPEAGLPVDLLAKRPDVRAAGLQLRAADWQVSAARADRLPALRLTASASYGAEEWELLFDNWMASLGGSITGPVFDAGRRKAEVKRARAVVDERLAAYKESVLQAVKEVENALFQETKQAEYLAALQRQLDAARGSHEQALERYRKGLNDYLPVLSALSELQVLERSLVQARFSQVGYRVQLCRALGSSWMKEHLLEQEKTKK